MTEEIDISRMISTFQSLLSQSSQELGELQDEFVDIVVKILLFTINLSSQAFELDVNNLQVDYVLACGLEGLNTLKYVMESSSFKSRVLSKLLEKFYKKDKEVGVV